VKTTCRKIGPTKIVIVLGIVALFFVFVIFPKNTGKQNFTKGVVAVNTDKQIYLPGETVHIQMGALDSKGHTLCNANLLLEIQGKKQKNILHSSTCGDDNVTNNPDYFFDYQPTKTGTYTLKLTNKDTGQVTKNQFTVVAQRSLDIVRETATRINPFKADRYPVKLTVTASQDYQGSISDTVPQGFTIPWQGPATIQGNQITWQVTLKAGETKELLYEYSAPKVSPEIYLLGNQGEWQIASDYACTLTVTASVNWNGASWANCNSSYPGASNSSDTATITTTATSNVTITLNVSPAYTLGAVTFNTPSSKGITLVMGTYSLKAASLTLSGTSSTLYTKVTISTGTLETTGNISFSNSNDTIVFSGAGALKIGGTLGTSGGFTASTSTVTFNGSAAQTINGYTFYNVIVNNTAATGTKVTTAGTFVVGGTLTVTDGQLDTNTSTFSVTGTTTINSGGEIDISSATGSKTFSGAVTINSGGIFTFITAAETAAFGSDLTNSGTVKFNVAGIISLAGNLVNNGTWDTSVSATGAITMSGSSKTISGSGAITFASLAATSVTNSATLTITGVLSGTLFTNSATGTLNLGATPTVTTLTASAAGNTVNYNGTVAETAFATSYSNLILSGSGIKTTTGITSLSSLTISGSATMASNGAFTLSGAFTYNSSGSTTLSSGTAITIGSFNQSAGTLIDNSVTITVTGTATPWTKSGGTFTSTGSVSFTGNADLTLFSGTVNFYNLNLTPTITANRTYTAGVIPTISGNFAVSPTAASAYTLTYNLPGDLVLNTAKTLAVGGSGTGPATGKIDTTSANHYSITTGTVEIDSNGLLVANSSVINVYLHWINYVGVSGFTYGTSTVNFAGASTQMIESTTTFYNLSITTSTARTIYFYATTITSIADNGNLTLTGTNGNLLTLASSSTAVWNLHVSQTGVTQNVQYVSVSRSYAGPVGTYTAINATADGNVHDTPNTNTNWNFPPPVCTSKASGNWSAATTWNTGCSGTNGQPIAGDTVTIQNGHVVSVDSAQAALKVTINTGSTLTFANSSSLTITGTTGTLLTNNGTFTAVTNSTVIFTGTAAPTALLSGTFTGSNAFYDLTLSPTISGAVNYPLGAAFTANHNFTLDPTSAGSNALTVTLGGPAIISNVIDLKGETSATSTLNTGSDYALTAGTLNIEAPGTLTANNSLITLNGTIGPLFTRTGTFNAGGSTVIFSENSADIVLTSGTCVFNTLQINLAGHTGTLGNPITLDLDLAVLNGTLADGGYQIIGNGTGTLSLTSGATLKLGSSTATTFPTLFTNFSLASGNTIEYASSQAQNVLHTVPYSNLTLSAAGLKSLLGTTAVSNTLTIGTGATLTTSANSYGLSLAGDWINYGTFIPGSGTVTFNGTSTQSIAGTASTLFHNLTDTNSIASVIPTADLSIADTLNVSSAANFTSAADTVTFKNGSSIANSGTLVFYNLAIDPSAIVSTSSNFSITHSLSVDTAGNFVPSAGAITFTGGSITNLGTLTFVDINISGPVTTDSNFSLSGNWSSTGNFSATAGTVTFAGANNSTQSITGNNTFNNLTISTSGNSANRNLQFAGSSTTTVSDTWTVSGASSKTINLRSSNTDPWTISPANASLDYVSLTLSVNTVGNICAAHSTDGGSNSGYIITSLASCLTPTPTGLSALIAYYKFDEGHGSVSNNSGNLHSQTPANISGPTWSNNGKFGKALIFSGSSSFASLTTNDAYNFTDDFTISAWIKPANFGNGNFGVILDRSNGVNGFSFTLNGASNSLRFRANGTNIDANANIISVDVWQYVSVVHNGSNLTFYVNGLPQGSSTLSAITSAHNATCHLGNNSSTTAGFNGLIDEVKIYSSALDANQVKIDFNHGAYLNAGSTSTSANYCVPGDSSLCSSPVTEYNFEEASGTVANDISSNENDGTWSGTGSHWTNGKVGKAGNFNGTDDSITIGDPSNGTLDFGTGSFTYSLWVNVPASAGTSDMPWYKGGSTATNPGYDMELGTGDWQANVSDGSTIKVASFGTETLNQWIFLTAVVDRTNNKLYAYRNGILIGNGTNISGLGSLSNSVAAVMSFTGYRFKGLLDNVRIYDYARTPAQIAWDYNQGKPVAWWKMNECSGTVVHDSSEFANHGTFTVGSSGTQTAAGTCTIPSTAWGNGATGKSNASLSFDGTDDSMSTADSPSFDMATMTISAWIKTANSSEQCIAERNNSTFYFCTNAGKLRYYLNNVGASWTSSTKSINDNIWHHVVATWDGTNKKLYVDGLLDTTAAGSGGDIANSTYGINIGVRKNSVTSVNYFQGQIDDVRLFNYPLTAEQIKQIYNNGTLSL
jgi:hypothetical protein